MTQPSRRGFPAHPSSNAFRRIVNEGLIELGRLGTPDAIACFLIERGLTGRPTFTRECPVARFLQQKTGWADLGVDTSFVIVENGIKSRVYRNPHAVTAFLRKFDRGEYPALEDEPASDCLVSA